MTLTDEGLKTPTKKLLIFLLMLKLRLQKAVELIDIWQLEKSLTKIFSQTRDWDSLATAWRYLLNSLGTYFGKKSTFESAVPMAMLKFFLLVS